MRRGVHVQDRARGQVADNARPGFISLREGQDIGAVHGKDPHEAVADEFSNRFAQRLAALRVGPGLDDGTELGPLVNEDTRTKVATLVDEATKTLTFRIEMSSYPNWDGIVQKRTITGFNQNDVLTYTNTGPATGTLPIMLAWKWIP